MKNIEKNKKYSISEVSKITGYDKHVLRYYEDDFNLEIPRTKSNRRYYTYKELETFLYIKELQEKGLTNKQIKLILESPEILLQNVTNEMSITALHNKEGVEIFKNNNYPEIIKKICNDIVDIINKTFYSQLRETKNEIIGRLDCISKEKDFIENTKEEDQMQKDALLCENAKLKLKVKEKSYEVARLKEQVNKLNQKNMPFWKKIFL